MHNFKTLFTHAYKEWTTWVGLAIIWLICFYPKEVHTFIANVLTSDRLADEAINGIVYCVTGAFILYRHKK